MIFLVHFNPTPEKVANLSDKFTLKAILRGKYVANYNAALGNSISHQIILLCFSCQYFILHVCYSVACLVAPAVTTQPKKTSSMAMKATLAPHSYFNSSI